MLALAVAGCSSSGGSSSGGSSNAKTTITELDYFTNYPKVSQAIWTAIQSAITGTSSVNSALQTAQGTISGVQLVGGG